MKRSNPTYINLFIFFFSSIFFDAQSSSAFSWIHEEPDSARYSTKEINGVWWLIDKDGHPFFSNGVCCVNTGVPFDEYNVNNPSYAAWQKFSDPVTWANSTADSLKNWNFSTIGGWSSMDLFNAADRTDLYYTPVLIIGMEAGAPWFDMWDSVIVKRMEEICKRNIPPPSKRKNLIGYYTDNEMGWWNAALWNMTFQHDTSSIARKKMIQLIEDHYHNKWETLLKDFDPEGAENFEQLKYKGRLFLRPGSSGIIVVKKFIEMIADRYYSLTKEIIRKYDEESLILGDRYQSFYYPEVATAAAKYVDVVSTNFNANWNDGTISRFYFSSLYELTKKPIAIGEFYMTAAENRSGNKNTSATFPVVKTQKERAKGFTTTAKSFTQLPFIVMADWFQYFDEPTHGRSDGENYNMGLVDIYGEPYRELIDAAKNFDWEKEKSNANYERADASGGIPIAPKDRVISNISKEILQNWNREEGFVKPVSKIPMADMYICWNPDTLYVAIYGDDVIEKEFYRNNQIPEEDRMLLTINFDGKGEPLTFRLGSGMKPVWSNPVIDVFNASGIFLSVRNISVIKIPASYFGKNEFKSSDRMSFSADLKTFARAYSVQWKLNSYLSDKF